MLSRRNNYVLLSTKKADTILRISFFCLYLYEIIYRERFAGFEVGVFGVVSSQWNGSNWLSLFVQLGLRDE